MKVKLSIWVEDDEGSHFLCAQDPQIVDEFIQAQRFAIEHYGPGATINMETMPPGMLTQACAAFMRSVRGWQGVVDEDTGDPLPCNEVTKACVPPLTCFEVMCKFLERTVGIEVKEPSGDAPPTPPSASGGELPDTAFSPSPST